MKYIRYLEPSVALAVIQTILRSNLRFLPISLRYLLDLSVYEFITFKILEFTEIEKEILVLRNFFLLLQLLRNHFFVGVSGLS